MPKEVPQMLAIQTVAERLGVTHWTVRTWLKQGRLGYTKVGRRLLVRADAVEALLEQNNTPASRPA